MIYYLLKVFIGLIITQSRIICKVIKKIKKENRVFILAWVSYESKCFFQIKDSKKPDINPAFFVI